MNLDRNLKYDFAEGRAKYIGGIANRLREYLYTLVTCIKIREKNKAKNEFRSASIRKRKTKQNEFRSRSIQGMLQVGTIECIGAHLLLNNLSLRTNQKVLGARYKKR